jgi:hypothetical protein
VAQAIDWPGDARIETEVTPLRVVVRNGSDTPIQIRHRDFKLKAATGRSYEAVAPRQVRGVVHEEDPALGPAGLFVAPYYGSYYAGVSPYAGRHDDYWETTSLPTRDMLNRALPEGVVKASGERRGYLYFQRVQEQKATPVTLEVEFSTAGTARPFASVRMPFVVG